jgi:hypothetical protein
VPDGLDIQRQSGTSAGKRRAKWTVSDVESCIPRVRPKTKVMANPLTPRGLFAMLMRMRQSGRFVSVGVDRSMPLDSKCAGMLYIAFCDDAPSGGSKSNLTTGLVAASGIVMDESATRSTAECPSAMMSISRSAVETFCGPPSTISRRATRSSPTPTMENM